MEELKITDGSWAPLGRWSRNRDGVTCDVIFIYSLLIVQLFEKYEKIEKLIHNSTKIDQIYIFVCP